MPLNRLEPKALWKHFDTIRRIPHGSGKEAALAEAILRFARERGLEAEKDEAGNVVVRVPASEGFEKAPVTVLQGHLDMVCEKNTDVDHDFDRDPIDVEVDGDWVRAKGTTLGADNGVGVAAALAVAESDGLVHGPLELLFTVDEEVGLTGAGKLGKGFVKGRRMLNLDSEETGVVTIGCAGGGDSTLELDARWTAPEEGEAALRVRVSGLRGGHSGVDIHEQRGNAIRVLARLLWRVSQRVGSVRVAGIQGGNKRNAIPREAEAVVTVPKGALAEAIQEVHREAADVSEELGRVEPDLTVQAGETSGVDRAADADTSARLVRLLLAIPHGVDRMSDVVPGLVETSNNLATVEVAGGSFVVGTSSRSSVASALEAMRARIRAVGELAGARVSENEAYPGWTPNPDSPLLATVVKVHRELFGKEPEIKAIHAGLECGIIGERFPGMDMVSIGPRIENPHSPEERVSVTSVQEFWKLLVAVLEELAKG